MYVKYGIAALFSSLSLIVFAGDAPKEMVTNGYVTITTPGGKKQTIPAKNATSDADVKFLDLTFQGRRDLLVLRDRGANQEFYDVYLYSKQNDNFIYSKSLSEIPCLSVDAKNENLVGQCFHASACENWEEYYSVTPDGKTSLVRKRGTYCDPGTGQTYKYIDLFHNGKRISSNTTLVQ